MAEQLVNEFTVNRPIDEAWPVICDVERIAPCLPGAQLEEIEGDVYRGIVKVKLGRSPPSSRARRSSSNVTTSNHHAVLKAEGRDTGGRGNAEADITADAESVVADEHQVHRHDRPAHHRQGRPVRAGHHGRRQQEADGPVRRQPQHDARRARQAQRRVRQAGPTCRRARRAADTAARADEPRRLATDRAAPRRRRCARSTAGDRAGRPRRRRRAGRAQARRSGGPGAARRGPAAAPPPADGEARPRAGRELLGREPQGEFEVVVRDDDGDPGRAPQRAVPRRRHADADAYWLVGPDEVRAVSRLEAAGGVAPPSGDRSRRARRRPPPLRGRTRRRSFPPATSGPRPSGGVGGTRTGVKCLHAHYAWHLAGGDDPVGRWVAERIERPPRAARLHAAVESATAITGQRTHAPAASARRRSGRTCRSGIGHPHARPVRRQRSAAARAAHQRARRGRRPLRRRRAQPPRGRRHRRPVVVQRRRGDQRWPASRLGVDDVAAAVRARRATRPRRCSARVATETATRAAPQSRTTVAHVDTDRRTCCIVLAVMRRFHLDRSRPAMRRDCEHPSRHPSMIRRPQPLPPLRPAGDAASARRRRLRGVERGPLRNEDWLHAVGAARAAGVADPDARQRGVRRPLRGPRPRARGRHGIPVRRVRRQQFAGEINLNNVDPRRAAVRHRRLLDRPRPRRSRLHRRGGRRRDAGSRSRNCSCIVSRSASCRATPTADG